MKRACLLLCLLFISAACRTAQPQPEPAAEETPPTEQKESPTLERLRNAAEDSKSGARQTLDDYLECKELAESEDFGQFLPALARRAARAAENAETDLQVEIALTLHRDEYPELARPLLEQARDAMTAANRATRRERKELGGGAVRVITVPEPRFVEVVEALGWVAYSFPPEMNACIEYDVEGAQEYSTLYNYDIDPLYRDVGRFPPDVARRLQSMEAEVLARWRELLDRDQQDGFALKARKAWLRFRHAQDSKASVDRRRGRRSFSPKAMGREGEAFDDIWTYGYAAPFVLFIEKSAGRSQEAGDDRLALLGRLHEWFNEHFIREFNLSRYKPRYNAAQADEEGWPFEIFLLKDEATFDQYREEAFGEDPFGEGPFLGDPFPGDAVYVAHEDRLITWADSAEGTAMLARQAFMLLSDHYAPNPVFDVVEMYTRPRYSSLLVQDGLAAAVAGHAVEGGRYQFNRLDRGALRVFKEIYGSLDNNALFPIRDLIDCRHNGQVQSKATERLLDLGLARNRVRANLMAQQVAAATYNATACQAAHFFHHYEEEGTHPYRDKWWDFIKAEYQGKHKLESFSDDTGVKAFKQVFQIETEEDWDKLEEEFLNFTLTR